MKRRWPLVVAYVLALMVQIGLLAGAYELHLLSQTKMGVMRYFVAQNVTLETSWFSPGAVLTQLGVLLFLAIVSALGAVALLRRGARFTSAQTALAMALAASGVWLATSLSTEDVYALYAVIAAVWAALLVQAIVVVVLLVRSAKAAKEKR